MARPLGVVSKKSKTGAEGALGQPMFLLLCTKSLTRFGKATRLESIRWIPPEGIATVDHPSDSAMMAIRSECLVCAVIEGEIPIGY